MLNGKPCAAFDIVEVRHRLQQVLPCFLTRQQAGIRKLINPTYFSHKFKEIVRGLDSCDNRLHVHSTRHTWATNMIHLGVSIPDVQALGGWSRPNVLLEIYSHTLRDSQKDAMTRLAERFKL